MHYHVVSFHKCASNWTRRLFRHIADAHEMSIWADLKTNYWLNKNTNRESDDKLFLYTSERARHHYDTKISGGGVRLFYV